VSVVVVVELILDEKDVLGETTKVVAIAGRREKDLAGRDKVVVNNGRE
jgi:hypothetical protein